jgi:hypothetical protein
MDNFVEYKNFRLMDLQARKYQFIQELFKIDSPSIMDKLEEMLRRERDEMHQDTLEEYNRDIDDAVSNIDKGEFLTQKEAREAADKW